MKDSQWNDFIKEVDTNNNGVVSDFSGISTLL
jgi:hypothetical protein